MKVFAMPYFCENITLYVSMKVFAVIGFISVAASLLILTVAYLTKLGDKDK